jgi:hypothetical protein
MARLATKDHRIRPILHISKGYEGEEREMFRPRISNNAKAIWNSDIKQTESKVVSFLSLLKHREGYRLLMKERPNVEGNHRRIAQSHCETLHSPRRTPKTSNIHDIASKKDRFAVSTQTMTKTSIRKTTKDLRTGNCREDNNRGCMPLLVDICEVSVVNLSRRQKIPKKAQQKNTVKFLDKPIFSPRGTWISLQTLPADVLYHWPTTIMYGAKILISAVFFYYTRIAMSVSMAVIVGLLYRNYLCDEASSAQIPYVIFVSKHQNKYTVQSIVTHASDDISLISETTRDV